MKLERCCSVGVWRMKNRCQISVALSSMPGECCEPFTNHLRRKNHIGSCWFCWCSHYNWQHVPNNFFFPSYFFLSLLLTFFGSFNHAMTYDDPDVVELSTSLYALQPIHDVCIVRSVNIFSKLLHSVRVLHQFLFIVYYLLPLFR